MFKQLLHRPIAVTMTLIACIVVGAVTIMRIPVSLMPDVDIPRITVQMSAPGMTAREIEEQMVTPMRHQLAQVADVKNLESQARTDVGTIVMEFKPGSNMSLLFIEVNEKIDRAMMSMPADMERPKVLKASSLDIPAFYINITGESAIETSRLVRNVITKRIEQQPEVAMVDFSGTIGAEIIVQPDIEKMHGLGITTTDIEKAIQSNNIILEALSVRDGIYRYAIHFDAQLMTVADIKSIFLNLPGRTLQLGDICNVHEQTAPRYSIVRSDGKEAVTLAVIKQSDAQMETLRRSLQAIVEEMQTDYPELTFSITRDQTELLSYSIRNLGLNLVLGTIMACLVLFLFIGGWRLPLVVIGSIPLSLIFTLSGFYLLGISLNIISLSGLILGVGMIVDNAIIVIDNIRQKRKMDDHAVVQATREVFMPMLASVLTTCSVFIPLIFLSGTAGSLFFDQAMGVSLALFSSLFVAAMVVPVYVFILLGRHKKTAGSGQNLLKDGTWWNRILVRYYERGLNWVFHHTRSVFMIFVACFFVIALLAPHIRRSRMPDMTQTDTMLTIDWNAGISVEENDRRTQDVLHTVASSLKASTTMCGTQDFMLSHTPDISTGEVVCYLQAASSESLDSVKTAILDYVGHHYPTAKAEFAVASNVFDIIFASGKPDLEIQLAQNDGTRPTLSQAHILTDSLRARFPSLCIQPVATERNVKYVVNAESLAYYGITYQQIYNRFKQLVHNSHIYEISSGGESVPVIVGGESKDAASVLTHTIMNKDGVEIPLEYLVVDQLSDDFKRLHSGANGKYYPIRIETASSSEIHDVEQYVDAFIHTHAPELKVSYGGEWYESQVLIRELSIVFIIALLLLYFILAAQFENLIQPGIILAEVAFDVCMVIIVLWLFNESLNLMTMIGLVVMSGIIINDSILKIDTINRYRKQGSSLLPAIVRAGHNRLKPIIMTSLTTILAILPLLRHGNMGNDMQFPLSLVIIVGMLIGTFVSLYFVPLAYYHIYRIRH